MSQVSAPDNTITPQHVCAAGAAQINTATLPATPGRVQYLEGFEVTGGGATAASVVELAITGVVGAPIKYEINVLAGVTGPINAQGGLFITFEEPMPATGPNVAIVATLPSLGAGNTNASIVLHGFVK